MRSFFVWLALVAALAPGVVAAQTGCMFQLGFKAIYDQIPQMVGRCVEDEHMNVFSGNAEQRTTAHHGQGGLLVWRKADNWTAYTDGHWTWVNGPNGLQRRLNAERFAWESDGRPVTVPPATSPPRPSAPTVEQCMQLPPNAGRALLEACIAVLEASLGIESGGPASSTTGAESVRVTVEVDYIHNRYIIQRRNGEQWLIEFGVGCLSLPVGRDVLVVSPGRFAGVGSTIVDTNRQRQCRIWDARLLGR